MSHWKSAHGHTVHVVPDGDLWAVCVTTPTGRVHRHLSVPLAAAAHHAHVILSSPCGMGRSPVTELDIERACLAALRPVERGDEPAPWEQLDLLGGVA